MKGFFKITLAILPLLILFIKASVPVSAQDIFWSTPTHISQSSNQSILPVIASDSKGYVHSAWMESAETNNSKIFNPSSRPTPGILYSFWNGDSWSTPLQINNPAKGLAESPSIAITPNDNVHIVWDEDAVGEETEAQVYYAYWNGSLWSTPVSLTSAIHKSTVVDGYMSAEWNPIITTDSSNNLYIIFAYSDETRGDVDMYYIKYTNSTSSWSTPVSISQGLDTQLADIAVDSLGNIHILFWNMRSDVPGIYYTYYNGSAWSSIQLLRADAALPRLLVDNSNNLHAGWYLHSGSQPGSIEYSRKPSGSSSWSTPFVVSTTVARSRWAAALTGLTLDSGGNAYVGWGQYNSTWYNNTWCSDTSAPGCGSYGVDAMYRKYTVSTDTWSTPNIVRSTKYLDAPTIWRDKWWNQHFIWSEMNLTTNQWEFWYSEVPANVGTYTSAQMTITMEVTGDTLKIPVNALSTNATISAQVGPVPSSADPLVTTIPRSYTFRPHGTTFINNKVATATILYSDAELIGSDERNLKAYIWDATLSSGAGGWTSNSFSQSTNTNTNKLTATLPHFSLYGIQAPKIQALFQSPQNPYFGFSIPLSYKFINLVTNQPADPPAQRTIMVENEDGTTTPAPFWDEYKAKLVDSEGTLIETLSYDAGNGDLNYDASTSTYTGTFSCLNLTEGDYTIEVYLASTIPVGSQTFHYNPQAEQVNVTFLPPLTDDTLYSLKDGSTLPVKFTLTYECGTWVEAPTSPEDIIVIIKDTNGLEKHRYFYGTGGDNVRYDPTTNQYIANVHTKELGLGIGTYKIEVLVKGQAQAQSPTGSTVFQLAEPGKVKGAITP